MSIWNRIRVWRAKRSPAYRRLLAQRNAALATVTLTIDATAFVDGMTRASRAVEQMRVRLGEIDYRSRLLAERTAARRWYVDYITAVYAEYGWEWPGPVSREAA